MSRGKPSLVERRLRRDPDMTEDQLSRDLIHTQAKLAAKRETIRNLEAKIRRLETVLRAEGTWADYQAGERDRAQQRAARRNAT